MGTASQASPKERLVENLATLQEYARRVLLLEQTLEFQQQVDQQKRMQDTRALASLCGLSEKDLVLLLYRSLFTRSACDCYTCRLGRGQHA